MAYRKGLIICLRLKVCLCVVLLFCLSAYSVAAERYNSSERAALLNLRGGLQNNTELRKNWTGPQCTHSRSHWTGITCVNGRVTQLILEEMGLQGSIMDNAFTNLTELKAISFRKNKLNGRLPSLLALSKLQFIDFSRNKFTGNIPKSSRNMRAWKQLKLHDNTLSGPIPSSLVDSTLLEAFLVQNNNISGSIPPFNQEALKFFNVSYNNLVGQIPNTAIMQSFNPSSFLGNPGLCGKPLTNSCPAPPSPSPSPSPHGKKSKEKFWVIIGIVIPVVAGLVIMAIVLFCCCRNIRTKESPPNEQKTVELIEAYESCSTGAEADRRSKEHLVFMTSDHPPFDIDDLLKASAELLGRGNFGSTYRAVLESGESMAVKRLKDMEGVGKKEFEQQMDAIRKLQHKNLVPIVAYYFSRDEKLIVYNYMIQGSLSDRLHGVRGPGRVPLSWKSRLKIAQGVARGLAYLHEKLHRQKTPHGNLKSSNILLDENFEPLLTDYGLTPLLTPNIASLRMMAYRCPEYLHTKKVSRMADIWTLGIFLLELLTGKMYSTTGSPGADLVEVMHSVVRTNWTKDVLDLEISVEKEAKAQMLEVLSIALDCIEESPDKRPKMNAVLKQLEEIKDREHKEEENASVCRSSDEEFSSAESSTV